MDGFFELLPGFFRTLGERFVVASLLILLGVFSARAEVISADGGHFVLRHGQTVSVAPRQAFKALINPRRWWNPDHTWSGKAKHLSIDARAGGCFCERWPGHQVEHGRVVAVHRDKLLRLASSLGPLQEMALTGMLSFSLADEAGQTRITLDYRVHGTPSQALETLAPAVDKVLGEQLQRLAALLND